MKLFKDYVFTGKLQEGRREILLLQQQEETIFGIKLTVPVGSFSDGASTPKFADDWFGFDPLNELYLRAAVFHDCFYRTNRYSKWLCDLIFLVMIVKTPSFSLKRLFFGVIMFTAVTLLGKKAYDRYNSRK